MAVFYDCLTAAQTVIQGIGLTGIDNDHVIVRKLPWVRGAELPAVIISPISDTLKWVNNIQAQKGYGVHIVIITAGNQDLTSGLDALQYWRDQIEDALISDKLSAVASIVNLVIEPSGLILSEAFRKQYDASAFVARCISRETI